MKKVFVLSLIFCAFSTLAFSQVNAHAFGVRLGGGSYVGGELSYQQAVGNANRFEFDFGYSTDSYHDKLYAVGIYHWDWNITDALNWYVGPGAGAGLFTRLDGTSYLNVAIGGQVGIEYDFLSSMDVPVLASVDVRPMWDLLGDHAGLGWGAALGVRYIW
jgi:hypothetical protein